MSGNHDKQPCVYLLASRRRTLYIGVTSNLVWRVAAHRQHVVASFTCKYNVTRLVWYELHPTMYSAIAREKQIKRWRRSWKLALVEKRNSNWRDLYPEIAEL